MRWAILALFLCASCVIEVYRGVAAPANPGGMTAPSSVHRNVRLLAIGNSFSGNTTRFLGSLVTASGNGNTLTFGHAMIGGCPLDKHVALAEVYEKDPQNPQGRPYQKNQLSLRDLLEREMWDYVTIQQASIKSFLPETYKPWARKLYDYVKKYAPQAEVLVHQTWAYRDDDVLFRDGKFTADEMYRRLRLAYEETARDLDCRMIPVGDAFQAVRLDSGWRFDTSRPPVDPKSYQYPQQPDQGRTLHAGWRWNVSPTSKVLVNDTHHAGIAGEYLGACVWFEFLFGQSVVGNTFVPKGLDVENARFLQKMAHRVVTEGVRPPLPAPLNKE